MERIKKFLKTSGIYFFGSVCTKLISFILLPLYSNTLTTEEFGYFDYSVTILTIVVGVFCVEIWTGAIRFLLLKDKAEEKAKVVCSSLILVFSSTVLLSFVFIFLKMTQNIPYLDYIALYAVFYMLQSLYCAYIRGYQENLQFVISGVISSVLNLSINVYFVGVLNGGIEVLYVAFSVGCLAQIIYIESKIRSLKTIRKENIDWKQIKALFFFCLPLFINSISYWILTSYSKIIIMDNLGAAANGVYSMGLRFSSAITLVTSVLSLAWQELVFSEKQDTKTLYAQGLSIYMRLLVYGLLCALPILKIFYPLLINKEYMGAMILLPICITSTLCNAYADFVGKVVIAEGKTKIIFISSIVGAISCVIVAKGTVDVWGTVGVALAVLVGFLLSIMTRLLWIYKYFRGKVRVEKSISALILCGISVGCYYYLAELWYVVVTVILLLGIAVCHKDEIKIICVNIKKRG